MASISASIIRRMCGALWGERSSATTMSASQEAEIAQIMSAADARDAAKP